MENNPETILQLENVSKYFGITQVLHDITLQVKKGEIYGFLGPNGAGKTTLARMILGLIRCDKGSIQIQGHNINDQYKQAIRHVGAIVETPNFYSYLSGYDNLKLSANVYGDVSKEQILEVLEMVQMTEKSKAKVKTYSLGMRQRLGIARALLHRPELVILDEPTNGLDPQGIKEMRELIQQLAFEKDITFFISSHLLKEVEMTCTKVGILNRGKFLAEGQVEELVALSPFSSFEDYFLDLTKGAGVYV
ncbi:ABC transporter ATP-binding protein [Desulfuribacillus stibiiarsenatis]|uniref:ABC transporter ATP-binding protein n=1 Tax=Desulfuribacillus stibiiarsenatis TaxID=1390249 RepID=A0A1E5L5I0_9FIRM|nr:ABC transporter ATP-binding protein [Desulfuribacillus stibiiarsenatis]OEH85371.1 ABC transporter ATP-binding protein [Desulfuribacillus stibiiarsenatis]